MAPKIKAVSSTKVEKRNTKIILWGDTGTRKTEFPLRNLPDCLLIDAEGNGDACIGVPEIPEFLHIPIQSAADVAQIVEDASAGEYKFSDGRPVQTIIIDSATVLYAVRQDAGALRAERREVRKARGRSVDPDDVSISQADWGIIKRPLKRMMSAINAARVPYIVIIAREKPIIENDRVIGYLIDAMKGTDYDANLALHFEKRNKGWSATVTKVQGALAQFFPMGHTFRELDGKPFIKYASRINVNTKSTALDQVKSAEEDLAKDEEAAKKVTKQQSTNGKSFDAILAYAKLTHKAGAEKAKAFLKAQGKTTYNQSDYDEFIALFKEYPNWANAQEA